MTIMRLLIVVDFGVRYYADVVHHCVLHLIDHRIHFTEIPTTREGRHEITAELICFDREVSSEEALAELAKLGRRPGELRELLAACGPYLITGGQLQIVALGSEREGEVPTLKGNKYKEGELLLKTPPDYWSPETLFLAIPFDEVAKHKRE